MSVEGEVSEDTRMVGGESGVARCKTRHWPGRRCHQAESQLKMHVREGISEGGGRPTSCVSSTATNVFPPWLASRSRLPPLRPAPSHLASTALPTASPPVAARALSAPQSATHSHVLMQSSLRKTVRRMDGRRDPVSGVSDEASMAGEWVAETAARKSPSGEKERWVMKLEHAGGRGDAWLCGAVEAARPRGNDGGCSGSASVNVISGGAGGDDEDEDEGVDGVDVGGSG